MCMLANTEILYSSVDYDEHFMSNEAGFYVLQKMDTLVFYTASEVSCNIYYTHTHTHAYTLTLKESYSLDDASLPQVTD